jgi:[pyruvate, water dikinase]-phosphate phosphotransferase / [pyruvate, water dikinase] kinase
VRANDTASVVELHVISDSTGETAARLVAALEAQFPESNFVDIRHPRVESVTDLQLAVERMKGHAAVAIYTIVEPTLREAMRTLCRNSKIHYCDLLAQPLEAVAKVSGRSAQMTPRARPPLDDNYFRRIAAIEFAVKHDDGLGGGLATADIALVGVSRTSKTPLSIYLGYLGWKATNVPLVKGIEPPKQLFEIDAAKIVGLTIDAHRLAEIRSERIALMGGDRRYANLNEIYEDLEHAAAIHRRLGCPVIDVSELSIEEIALRIVRAVERRRNGAPAGGKAPP